MDTALAVGAAAALTAALPAQQSRGQSHAFAAAALQGIQKNRHVIIIMQENRSFDSYFGVYPGADGIPMKNGVPAVCVPDPMTGKCVAPPAVDSLGYGIRVPALVISPYARRGYIDPQTLSFDAYLKFVEDDFLGGARLDPKTDGRPDSRPTVRENLPILGNLINDFTSTRRPCRR